MFVESPVHFGRLWTVWIGHLIVLTALLLAAPLTEAQQAVRLWRVGVLGIEPWQPIDGLRDGLRQLGYTEGRTITLEYRWSGDRPERFAALAAELLKAKVDVIVTVGTPAALAAKRATSTVPIVMGLVGDPIAAGIVTSIARPGGNLTGVSSRGDELEPKKLEVLRELLPKLSRVGVLSNAANPFGAIALEQVKRGAANLGLKLEIAPVRGLGDLEEALARMTRPRVEAIVVPGDQFMLAHRDRIAAHVTRSRIPSAYTYREHVAAGGLLSYSTNYYESFRRAAAYVDRIIKGANPADLPIEQVDRFALVINLRTAKALGLRVSPSLRLRADELIE